MIEAEVLGPQDSEGEVSSGQGQGRLCKGEGWQASARVFGIGTRVDGHSKPIWREGGREAEGVPEGGVGADLEVGRSKALEWFSLDRVGPGRHPGRHPDRVTYKLCTNNACKCVCNATYPMNQVSLRLGFLI